MQIKSEGHHEHTENTVYQLYLASLAKTATRMLGLRKEEVESFPDRRKTEYFQACRDKKAYLTKSLCSNYSELAERAPVKKMMVHFTQVYCF